MKQKGNYYLVLEDYLPRVLRLTVEAKEMLKKGEAKTVNEAAKAVGISRAAFYKYRDAVFPFSEAGRGKIITILLMLDHTTGVLSEVLKTIATAQGNILTINQGLPLQGVADASISFETEDIQVDLNELLARIRRVPGVRKLELVGQN